MLLVGKDLASYTLAAGEPFVLEVQLLDSAGRATDLDDQAMVLTFYTAGTRALVTDFAGAPSQYEGERLSDTTGEYFRWAFDGRWSEAMLSKPGLRVELAQRLFYGRSIISTGTLSVVNSSAVVPSLPGGSIALTAVRVSIKANAVLGGAPQITQTVILYDGPSVPIPAPAFTTPSSIASDGTPQVGELLTGIDGVATNALSYTRRWLLGSTLLTSSATYTPPAAGSYRYETIATGPGGETTSGSNITVAAATVTPTLALSPANPSLASNAAAGTLVSSISNVPSGVTPSVTPNDGRLVIAGDASAGWKVVVGMSALSAGTINFSVAATGATGASGVLTVTAAAAVAFTMTQLAAPNRIYQRSTTTNGGQSKGRGTIPVTLDVSTTGSVYARVRASNGTILQASWVAATTTATGAQNVNIANVDARLGWFYLDLSGDGSTWQNGTVLVGMGRLYAVSGQSQMVRQIAKMPDYVGTNASLGVTIDPNTSAFARYEDPPIRSDTTLQWRVPADSSPYDGTFLSEFLRLETAAAGVNCALIGSAVGNTAISAWLQGTTNYNNLASVLDAAGGFEAFFWHQGGNDAGANTTETIYKNGLTSIFTGIAAHNTARGTNFEKYVCTAATRLAGGAGTVASVTAVRKAASDWCAANGGVYLEPHDVTLEDNVHQGQPGNIILAGHAYRATRPALGLPNDDNGPVLASGIRATGSAIVELSFNLAAGASLVGIGAPGSRFSVFNAGTMTSSLAIASSSVANNKLTLTLASAPANDQALDVWAYLHPDPSGTTANANGVYDNVTNNDGITRGRQAVPSRAAVNVSAPGGSTPTPTPTPTPSPLVANFDGTGPIASYTSDSGHTFTQPSGTHTLANSAVYGATSSNAVSSWAPLDPIYQVTASLVQTTAVTGNTLVRFRVQDDTNYWFAGLARQSNGTHNWIVGYTVAGTPTTITGGAVTVTLGQTYALRVDVGLGGNHSLYVDGTLVNSAPDNQTALANAGSVGLRQSVGAATATTGARILALGAADI